MKAYRHFNPASKLIFVPQEIMHHVQSSSMDVLLTHFSEANVLNVSTFKSISRIFFPRTFAKTPANLSNHKFYSRSGFLVELFLGFSRSLEKRSGKIIHYLNLGNDYHYLGLFDRKDLITGTVHLPPGRFAICHPDPWYMEKLAGIVMIAPSQKEYIDRYKNSVRHLIPHGVNTDLFKPAPDRLPASSKQLNVLFTGSHLRDFNSLAHIIDYITARDQTINFTVVTHVENIEYLRSKILYQGSRINYLNSLTTDQYVRRFQEADLFLFPLIDITATQSLNEALASGLPIITNDMENVRYYTDNCDGVVLFKKGNWRGMAEWILDLGHDSDQLAQMGKASRKRAEQFLDWSVVAKQYHAFFDAVGKK